MSESTTDREDAYTQRRGVPAGIVRVEPGDSRYTYLTSRGANRFRGCPDEVYVVGSTAQTVRAVQQTVNSGRRLAIRAGGHCFEDFVDHPSVRTLIDISELSEVYYDPVRHAFVVEAGATLGEAFRRLHLGWGVTVPGGYCPDVGAGGHVAGGGYGPLCRLMGLVVDHLYAVEVVVVDRAGTARTVYASREEDDPNRELWWAHTGGGGGTFGVVTRYWFRSPGTTRHTPPERLLPAPPPSVLTFSAHWDWNSVDVEDFTRMVRGHGAWAVHHSGTQGAALYSEFLLTRRASGSHMLIGQVAAPPGEDERLLREHLAAIGAGTAEPRVERQRLPWLTAALRMPGESVGDWRLKIKSGYLRRPLSEDRIHTLHRHLSRTDVEVQGGSLSLNTFGGRVNEAEPGDTAVPQRDSVLKLSYLASWRTDGEEAAHLRWLRELYRDMYADSGGVPVPGATDDGAFINYPDTDLADPVWNTSEVPWQELYFKGGADRLARAKARWDPRGIFHHALSVRPAT